jgi:hypothetical protein
MGIVPSIQLASEGLGCCYTRSSPVSCDEGVIALLACGCLFHVKMVVPPPPVAWDRRVLVHIPA